MKKIIKYDGTKTFMYPNGALATPERVIADFPAVQIFTHIIETDEQEQVCFAVQNLAAMRGIYGVDGSLTEDEAIAKINAINNFLKQKVDEKSTMEQTVTALKALFR